jgi:hypothetical protein
LSVGDCEDQVINLKLKAIPVAGEPDCPDQRFGA